MGKTCICYLHWTILVHSVTFRPTWRARPHSKGLLTVMKLHGKTQLDDVIIEVSEVWESHMEQPLSWSPMRGGLTANPKKCKIGLEEARYLGKYQAKSRCPIPGQKHIGSYLLLLQFKTSMLFFSFSNHRFNQKLSAPLKTETEFHDLK